jgi:hypothetical protein
MSDNYGSWKGVRGSQVTPTPGFKNVKSNRRMYTKN